MPSSNQCLLTPLKPSPCTWFPFQPSFLRKTALKYLSVHLRYDLAENLPDGTLWNLSLAGERVLFHKPISLAVLDNASNQRHQTAQTTQTIILLGYYPHSQLRNTECYPMRKCDMGDCKYQTLWLGKFRHRVCLFFKLAFTCFQWKTHALNF